MKTNKLFAARLAAVGLMALLMSACAAPAAPSSGAMNRAQDAAESPAMPAPAAPAATAAPAAGAPGEPAQPRLIIRTADLNIVVKSTPEQLDAISKLATQYGGFVVSSGTSRVGTEMQGQITLRVDTKNFDAALSDIRKLALEVQSENVRGEDVTAEYVDLDSQLKNLEAAESQLQKIMAEATNTEDVLNVYQRLIEIRGQIDQIKGRMKYLSQSAALSTINVSLTPDALAQPVAIGGWRVEGVLKSAVEALIGALQALVSIAIWLVIVALPILVLIALPIVAIIWVIRRAQKRRMSRAN